MSTTLVVSGYRDMDGEFARMLEIKQYCEKMHVSYPLEVRAYFLDHPEDSEEALRDEMAEINIEDALETYCNTYANGYTLDLTKLRTDVRYVRVSFSY